MWNYLVRLVNCYCMKVLDWEWVLVIKRMKKVIK